jgi:hypothetical protein
MFSAADRGQKGCGIYGNCQQHPPQCGANFRETGCEYAGLRLNNETTSAVNYGFVEMRTIGATGFPATIMACAYDDSGVPMTVESLEGIFISDFE